LCFLYFIESVEEENKHRNEIAKRTYLPNPGEIESEDVEAIDLEE